MSATYTLKILADFASAHTLRDYPGDCRRMHGHNCMDFKTIKTATRELAKTLDHRYLNDIPPFDEINPTAENIAQFFYQRLSDTLNTDTARVSGVTVWETDRACVKYSED